MYFLGIIISFVAGFLLILSKTCNMSLSKNIGVYGSNMLNYLTGLALSGIFLAASYFFGNPEIPDFGQIPLYVYLGGPLGAAAIIISNFTMSKTTVITTTIIALAGQMAGSMVIDTFLLNIPLKPNTFLGSMLILCGVVLFLIRDKKQSEEIVVEKTSSD